MSTVYVKVAADILPEKEGKYFLFNEKMGVEFGTLHAFKYGKFIDMTDYYSHYLQKVQLPSEEEIHVQSHKYSDSFDEQTAFRDGQRHILNLLNPTHNEQ